MKLKTTILSLLAIAALTSCGGNRQTASEKELSLKEALGDKFLVGVAVNTRQASGQDTASAAIVRRHFNSIVAENCMKCEVIHPEEGRFDFTRADEFVKFGEENGMTVIGHCLIWHSQLAPWFCVDGEGQKVSPEVLKARMKKHIQTIVSRYKGRIKGWDVVNEAIVEDGSYRRTPFYEILGEEFIPLAFQYAHEADPDAELYYNDYGMNVPGRRDGVVRLVNDLKRRGLRIDAVGMQGHMGMDYPSVEEFEESLLAFAATGVKVMVTEWDMSALPTVSHTANVGDTVAYRKAMNPYPDGLPDSVSRAWNARMRAFLDLFVKHSDKISRVTAWGVSDEDSWKNDFPVHGRRDYPLLFDRQFQPKPFLRETLCPKKAVFDPLVYNADCPATEHSGEADTTASPATDSTTDGITNPILPGCYPDPSICRVGDDYYLVNSSFAYFPAIPIWHSTDLKSWKQLGYVIDRPSQLNLKSGLRISGGIYAPDIQYNPHDRRFYVITTDVDGIGNFFITTDDPRTGEWSDPTPLPDVHGIDPSLFFDEDGKAYIVNNDAPQGTPRYDGHRAIWIREFDWRQGRTTGQQRVIVDGGVHPEEKPIWIEGPHLYRIGGVYYLMAAEGGTGPDHSEVIFSAASPFGPFRPCAVNPILTQRDLPDNRPNPVTCTGHADLVQTPSGEWYAVFLGVRPYKEEHDVMGRETFLHPVSWTTPTDGSVPQPVILPAGETLTYRNRPLPATPLWDKEGLSAEAFFIRTPQTVWYDIAPDGTLSMTARTVNLADRCQPSAIGRWITGNRFTAQTALTFTPEQPDDFAGLLLFQNDECNVRFGKSTTPEGTPCIRLEAVSRGTTCCTSLHPLTPDEAGGKLFLQVTATEGADGVSYLFAYASRADGPWQTVGAPVSANLLSTQTAGGFTGTMVGVYATRGLQ